MNQQEARRKRVVVLSGAGISAESGLKTFRDSGGLWEGHRVEEVATPEAWERNPELVLQFYNQRRRQLSEVEPNAAHLALARLEATHEVHIITQNVDDLHERAGSSKVLHLHGELDWARGTADPSLRYKLDGRDIQIGDRCENGSQLRPNIVWFGEAVPAMEVAAEITSAADQLIVVGTSLMVYPAASLAFLAPRSAERYLVNPEIPPGVELKGFQAILKTACEGIPDLVQSLIESS